MTIRIYSNYTQIFSTDHSRRIGSNPEYSLGALEVTLQCPMADWVTSCKLTSILRSNFYIRF